MKRTLVPVFLTTLLVIPIASVQVDAQETAVIPEPEQIGIPYLINGEKLVPLERQRTNVAVHLKAGGFGGGTSVVQFNGRTSPVRVASKNLRLVIRFASMPPTPSSLISLAVLVSKKDSRESIVGRVGPMGIGAKTTNGDSEIDLNFIPGRNAVLAFEPSTPLRSGEYVVTTKDGQFGYLFTVE